MPGKGRLNGHIGRLPVADFPDHDDVRVLPQQRSNPFRKAQVDIGLHLHLVEPTIDELDRVFNSADIHLGGGEFPERGVQRRRLAGTCRAGHQHDAVRLPYHASPGDRFRAIESEPLQVLGQHIRIEDSKHQLFTKGGGQRRDAQLYFLAIGRARADAPVLWAPALDYVQSAQNLDPAGDRRHHWRRQLIHIVQYAVDAKAHVARVAARLEMNVARPRIEGILQQPIDDGDDVLVLGRELAHTAQFRELLQVAQTRGREPRALLPRHLDGTRNGVELNHVPVDIQRICAHARYGHFESRREHLQPFHVERILDGEYHLRGTAADRQYSAARCIGIGDDLRNGGDIQLERVDAHIRQSRAMRKPLGQRLERQLLPR